MDNLESIIGITGTPWLSEEDRRQRIERSFTLPAEFRSVAELRSKFLGQTVCLVGGGLSLDDTLDELRLLVRAGAKVMAVNQAHDYLCARGIIPDFGIMADPKPSVRNYQSPVTGTLYLLASQVDDAVIDRFSAHAQRTRDVFIWHALCADGDADLLLDLATRHKRALFTVVGGLTTTMRADDVLAYLGFRTIHMFGVDSSGRDGRLHPYPKTLMEPPDVVTWLQDPANGRDLKREYMTNKSMAQQVMQFELMLRKRLAAMADGSFPKVRHVVHGYGLFPDWAALCGMHVNPYRATELRAEGYRDAEYVVVGPRLATDDECREAMVAIGAEVGVIQGVTFADGGEP